MPELTYCSSWSDSWSTRWNPTFFAEQGYIAVAINPTGSTGFGQKFTDAIKGQWGGLPYQDLVKGFEYLENNKEYSYIDFDNAVALGASYGGCGFKLRFSKYSLTRYRHGQLHSGHAIRPQV